jgi:NTP pyrophosphatase (non-canonical NTP hydrolase)
VSRDGSQPGEPFFFVCLWTIGHRPRIEILDDKRLSLDELTEKMHAFVRSKGWYEADSKRPQTPRNLSISLALEASEILEHFQWNEEFDKDELAEELADVALYLLQLASISEIDLEQAILEKLEINAKREWDNKR